MKDVFLKGECYNFSMLIRGVVVKGIVSFEILFINLILLLEGDSGGEVSRFLENIRQVIQKWQKVQNSRAKVKDKSKKVRIKKQIVQKLANPFQVIMSISHKSLIIKTDNKGSGEGRGANSDNNNQMVKSSLSFSPGSIRRVLHKVPDLLPFKFSQLSEIMSRSKNLKSNKNDSGKDSMPGVEGFLADDIRWLYSLREWYIELMKAAYGFWAFFKKFFIDNTEGLLYLRKFACKGEVDKEVGAMTKSITSLISEDIINRVLTLEGFYKIFSPLLLRGKRK